MQNTPDNRRTKKLLGRLETKDGAVIAEGGAQLNDANSGLFIPRSGDDVAHIQAMVSAILRAESGEVYPLENLHLAPATSNLPRHVTFAHGAPRKARSPRRRM